MLFRALISVTVLSASASCSNQLSFSEPEQLDSTGELTDSAKFFKDGLYGKILLGRCGECHTPSIQAPYFADVKNIQAGHDVILDQSLVNFQSPAQSRLAQKVRLNHNCWGLCTENASEIEAEIAAWAKATGQGSTGEILGYKSASALIPEAVATAQQTMQLSLNGAFPDMPAGTILQFKIRVLDASYKISEVGVFSSGALYFKTGRVYINNTLKNETSNFSLIDITTTAVSQGGTPPRSPSPLLGADFAIPTSIDIDEGPGLDTIMFVFDTISLPLSEKDRKWAVAKDKLAQRCNSCHTNNDRTVNKTAAAPLIAQSFIVPRFGGFGSPELFLNYRQGTLPNGQARFLVVSGQPELSSLYRSVAHGHIRGGVAESYPEIPQATNSDMTIDAGLTGNPTERAAVVNALYDWIASMDDPD